ncbi:MAG: AAA family ATPase [Myxococcota bacterium]
MAPQAALEEVRRELRETFIDRDREIDGLLIALLTGQHILLLGPPGTAKSMLARRLCAHLEGARYFEWLLTKFTTPEEIFGPIDLPALEQGRYERLLQHKLPSAEVAFLDEVFKANSAILNALLTLMNERRFHQGATLLEAPLETVVAASNELPEEDELRALYDRFLLRFQVGYVDDGAFDRLLKLEEPAPVRNRLSRDDLAALRRRLVEVQVPSSVLNDVRILRRSLFKEGVIPSDRRFRNSLAVLRAAALLAGREQVDAADLAWLGAVLWTDPEELPKVEAALAQIATGLETEAKRIQSQAKEIFAYALQPWPDPDSKARATLEAHTKLVQLADRLGQLGRQAESEGRGPGIIEQLKNELQSMQDSLLGAAN